MRRILDWPTVDDSDALDGFADAIDDSKLSSNIKSETVIDEGGDTLTSPAGSGSDPGNVGVQVEQH